MISVIILTKNEERDLLPCLKSVEWSDDVHVLDSGSTDQTVAIAWQHQASVSLHPFESFGQQRNHALNTIKLKHDWVLFLDADEQVPEKFRQAILTAVQTADQDLAGFYCCWKMLLEGKWLRYSDNFPKWQFRLLHKDRARFTDFGHGQKEGKVSGQIGYIHEPYLHYGFSKGWHQWIDRHNKYSTQEALARLNNCPPFSDIFARNKSVRHPALKSWLSRVPGWPFLRFLQAYFFNLGFLEGIPGFLYCINMGYYEFLIQIKMREITRNKENQTHY
jgi:glycosyltransferase involved in cell wall biosynthesis